MVRNHSVAATTHYWRRTCAIVLAVAIATLSGCAPISPNVKYLFAPEVRTCPPTLSIGTGGQSTYAIDHTCSARVNEPIPTPQPSGGASSLTVSQATNYARQIEEEYIGAKSEYGSVSSAVGIVLIPAGASALALGAAGESAAAVSGLGFGGAALLGAGYWLSNTKREKVYMTGADALECLVGTMQPFDVEQTDFAALKDQRDQMREANTAVASGASDLEEQLARVRSDPEAVKDPCSKPVLCYTEQALKAAKSNSQAESKAYDAALKYDLFSRRYAGSAMVTVVNTINNKVNEVMTDTEPDLHALANSLSGAIPQSAQTLGGISSAASATTAAATLTQKTDISQADAQAAAAGISAKGRPGAGGVCSASNQGSVGWRTREELGELFERSEALQWRNYRLIGQTETVVDLTPDAIKPKTESCTKLFDQPGVAPDVLTLNPDGYIAITQGGKQTIAISGGKLPFAVRLMSDFQDNGITAETKYDSGKATIEIDVSAGAEVNSYPLMVTDSTGIGRPLIIVVSKKADDSADTPDCAAAAPPQPTSSASISEITAMARVAASAHAYAIDAAKAAAGAKAAADKAEAAAKASKATEVASAAATASADAVNAYSAAAKAQAKSAEATTKSTASKDPIIQNLSQAAYIEGQKAAKSASAAAADAARASAAAHKAPLS